MLATLLLAAEEAAEPSKTPFYVLAGLLIAFAVIVSSVGISRHETFPPSRGMATAIMLTGMALVAGTMLTAVLTG